MQKLLTLLFMVSLFVSLGSSLHAQGVPFAIDDHQGLLVARDVLGTALIPEPEEMSAVRLDRRIEKADWLPEPLDAVLRWPRTTVTMLITVTHEKIRTTEVSSEVFNTLYNKPKVDEKSQIRAAWTRTFGIDVWRPYYVVKEIEDWIKERFSVKIFGFKGKPQLGGNKFIYVFKGRF